MAAMKPAHRVVFAILAALGAAMPMVSPAQETEYRPELLAVRLIDSQGRPVPDATVELMRTGNAAEVTLVNGHATFSFDPRNERGFVAQAPRHLAARCFWPSTRPVPAEDQPFVVTLPRAVPIGGVLCNPRGETLPNVPVRVSSDQLPPRTDGIDYFIPTVTSDENGRWICPHVPTTARTVDITVYPRDYPWRQWERCLVWSVRLSPGAIARCRFRLRDGVTITGRLLDQHGQPVAKGSVYAHFEFPGNARTSGLVSTDDQGQFVLWQATHSAPRMVAFAPGSAPTKFDVDLARQSLPLQLQLAPGRPHRIRVVDSAGNPLAGVICRPRRWMTSSERGVADFSIHRLEELPPTDDEGWTTWPHGPSEGTMTCEFRRTGYFPPSRLVLDLYRSTHIVTMSQRQTVSGHVTDAETGEPVERFLVRLGRGRPLDTDSRPTDAGHTMEFTEGRYEIAAPPNNTATAIRIEAAGYAPSVMGPFDADDLPETCDVQLHKAAPRTLIIETPSGEAAADARLHVTSPRSQGATKLSYWARRPGDHVSEYSLGTADLLTDALGRCQLPPQPWHSGLFVYHDDGCALLPKISDLAAPTAAIRLVPYGAVTGLLCQDGRPLGDAPVELRVLRRDGMSYPENIRYLATTDRCGRFRIENVVPGDYIVCREVYDPQGRTPIGLLSHATRLAVRSGHTASVTIGRGGRTICGRLDLDDSVNPVITGTVPPIVKLLPVPADVPWPAHLADLPEGVPQRETWLCQWRESPEGIRYGDAQPDAGHRYYRTFARPDQTFRIDNVPPGKYVLSVWQRRPSDRGTYDHGDQVVFTRVIDVPPVYGRCRGIGISLGMLAESEDE